MRGGVEVRRGGGAVRAPFVSMRLGAGRVPRGGTVPPAGGSCGRESGRRKHPPRGQCRKLAKAGEAVPAEEPGFQSEKQPGSEQRGGRGGGQGGLLGSGLEPPGPRRSTFCRI